MAIASVLGGLAGAVIALLPLIYIAAKYNSERTNGITTERECGYVSAAMFIVTLLAALLLNPVILLILLGIYGFHAYSVFYKKENQLHKDWPAAIGVLIGIEMLAVFLL